MALPWGRDGRIDSLCQVRVSCALSESAGGRWASRVLRAAASV